MAYEDIEGEKRVVTGYFDSKANAESALKRLVEIGVPRGTIQIVEGTSETSTDNDPYIGRGFWEQLKDMFVPEDDRHPYVEGLRRGGFVVSARVTNEDYNEALAVLDRDAVNLDERAGEWRSSGWTGRYDDRSALSSTTGSRGGQSEAIPIAEEELRVGKRDVSHGRVRVRSYIVEKPATENVTLREERVTLDRRPVDRAVTGTLDPFRPRTIEAEQRSEEPVVSKDVRVKEELVLNKDVSERTQTISDNVRHTEVKIEGDPRETAAGKVNETTPLPRR